MDAFASDFAPTGYALAQGQLLPINQNQALFSILGTTYGGDGRTTFALPDLRGRVPIGAGTDPVDGETYVLGEVSGTGDRNLELISNLAPHSHPVPPSRIVGVVSTTGVTGGGLPFENDEPTLALTPLITTAGIFPSRNFSLQDLLGSVNWFAGNFAPGDTALANGQILSIAQFAALFSILGTTYGGNGTTNFALPDLRGRMAIGAGQGQGLSPIQVGQVGGTDFVTPTVAMGFPPMATPFPVSQTPPARPAAASPSTTASHTLALHLSYDDIALQGIFPSRSLQTGEPIDNPFGPDPSSQGFISGNQVLDDATAMQLIAPLVQQGIQYWEAAGIDADQLATLESATVSLGDLDPGTLASTADNQITIDRDASGAGWFVDTTPGDNAEFGSTDPQTGELVATDPNAMGHYDLLTAIMHEEGHVLGLNHTPLPGHIMYGSLDISAPSLRLPQPGDLVQSTQPDSGVQFLEGRTRSCCCRNVRRQFRPAGLGRNQRATASSFLKTTLYSH